MRNNETIIIEFEDGGQDFLTWIIRKDNGEVIDCKPCQAMLWVGGHILNHTRLKVGGTVTYQNVTIGQMEIKYPIKSITNTNHNLDA